MIRSTNVTYINSTVSFCSKCNCSVPAYIYSAEHGVYLQKLCPSHKTEPVLIAENYDWYMARILDPQDMKQPKHPKEPKNGCPLDCGLCANHSNELHLPIFSITNDCNLNCPICFTYNRSDKKYYKSLEDLNKILDNIADECPERDIINLTGGEPTLHPDLFKIIEECKKAGFKRITVNTNGLKIAADKEFAKKIKSSGVQVIFSINTFDPKKSIAIHGADITEQKKRALEIFQELDIPITLLMVGIKEVNETDLKDLGNLYLTKSFVRSITIQNMTFTGANGSRFTPRKRLTIDRVEEILDGGMTISHRDFFSPGGSHGLCYSAAYYVIKDSLAISLSEFIPKDTLREMTTNGYILKPKKGFSRIFLDGINKYCPLSENPETIEILRSLFTHIYPVNETITEEERMQRAETVIKPIMIHAHMDEDNFDLDRVSRCADLVPDENGAMVPACSYNLVYRIKDERFWYEKN